METTKNRIILLLAVLVIALFIVNASSCNNSKIKNKNLDKEQAVRLNLEEKVMNLEQEIIKLKDVLKNVNQDFDTTKKLLSEQLLINENLKKESQQLSETKEALGKASKKR